MIINKNHKIASLILLGLFFINSVSAFAVSSAYHRENPLILLPEETRDFYLVLQNLASTEDVSVLAEIKTGSDILEITDSSDTYLIPGGGKTRVNLRATIPSDAIADESHSIEITFTTVTTEAPGSFGLGSSIGQKFKIIIGPVTPKEEPEEEKSYWLVYVITAVIALILILIIVIIKKKKKAKQE